MMNQIENKVKKKTYQKTASLDKYMGAQTTCH
jgi:hypothetical protein